MNRKFDAFMFGLILGLFGGGLLVYHGTEYAVIRQAEACWPNKPTWVATTEGTTCLLEDGREIFVRFE